MCIGIALAWSELPLQLIKQHRLDALIFSRGGGREVQFWSKAARPILPVWWHGQLQIISWGCRRQESKHLPCSSWTWEESVQQGKWRQVNAELVDIPATLGYEGGIWFRVKQGMRGLLVKDEHGLPHVYMICQPATHYYQIMTRSRSMPVLIGETI